MADSIFLKDNKEQICVDVVSGDKKQRLCVVGSGVEPSVVLMEGGARVRSWPLHAVRLMPYPQGCGVTLEAGGEALSWSCGEEATRRLVDGAAGASRGGGGGGEAALGALLELEGGGAEGEDAEAWVRVLGERVARLDADNVAGMLAAATQRDGARLAARLEGAGGAAVALGARYARARTALRPPGAPDAPHARPPAPDHNARALLHELEQIFSWLDAPPLRDLDSLSEVSLASAEGRSRALEAGAALCSALRLERAAGAAAWRRLRGVRDRLRRVARARDQLCAAAARHLNNLLIHLGNEAAAAPGGGDHHRQLLPYAPFMRFLKENDPRAYDALLKVYVSTWSRVYERAVRAGAGGAVGAAGGDTPPAADFDLEEHFDTVLTLAEAVCNAEQDFCSQFFHLDVDVKSDSSDGEKSEKSDGGECGTGAGVGAPRGRGGAGGGAESRRVLAELFPALEQELVALVQRLDAQRPYGAMRALACAGRRALGEGGGEGRWSRAVVATAAVCAKRAADRSLADTVAALPDHIKQASRRAKCGVLGFVRELEAWGGACEAAFAGGRRADLDRWYLTLVSAMMQTIHTADHPRTPRSVLHMENYHALGGAVAALRVPALEGVRRECRAREQDAQRAYVTKYFGRPLDKINLFFDGVSEAVAGGAREEEVCYRAAFSKHELRRLLQLYPANEVRKSLHRLYRTVEKHLSEEGGLLQVVWRAMQEEFLAQHHHLQARIAACYPGAGLTLPLSTQDILDAFSDIAREH